MKTFEEYLSEIYFKKALPLKQHYQIRRDKWMMDLGNQELMDYAQAWHEEELIEELNQ